MLVGRHRPAEAISTGDWSTPHLTDLLRLLIANRQRVEGVVYGTWGAAAYRITHLLNRNTKAGSQSNIHAHYDLGNAFYELWLDDHNELLIRLVRGRPGGDIRRPARKVARAR